MQQFIANPDASGDHGIGFACKGCMPGMSGRASVSYPTHQFELCFRSLFAQGRSLAFPCDAAGHVDMDALSEEERQRYFYARTVVGREFSPPAVERSRSDAEEDSQWLKWLGD